MSGLVGQLEASLGVYRSINDPDGQLMALMSRLMQLINRLMPLIIWKMLLIKRYGEGKLS